MNLNLKYRHKNNDQKNNTADNVQSVQSGNDVHERSGRIAHQVDAILHQFAPRHDIDQQERLIPNTVVSAMANLAASRLSFLTER